MEVHEHGFLLLAVWISRIVRGILCLSMSDAQPLAIDLRRWPQTWRRAPIGECRITDDLACLLGQIPLEIIAVESLEPRFVAVQGRLAKPIQRPIGLTQWDWLIGSAAVAVLQRFSQREQTVGVIIVACPKMRE